MIRLHNKVNKSQLKEQALASDEPRTTLSFYKYHPIPAPKLFRDRLYQRLSQLDVYGRIYIASEGINAQISLPTEQLDRFTELIYGIRFLDQVRLNVAVDDNGKSFYVLKIKVKRKIVADGLDDQEIDPSDGGKHIDAKTFNKMADSEDTLIVDMRNHYESEVGHFNKAICPDVDTFRDSLSVVEKLLESHQDKEIVMYCTGGIRCEKATAFFKTRGFKKLHQLDGGIIEYARQTEREGLENKFLGKNFVFDERLGERISKEIIARCHQCGDACDTHTNCANNCCHLLFIQCKNCARTFNKCCSKKCRDFVVLSDSKQNDLKPTIQFNGSKFCKGRYKAHKGLTTDTNLDLN